MNVILIRGSMSRISLRSEIPFGLRLGLGIHNKGKGKFRPIRSHKGPEGE